LYTSHFRKPLFVNMRLSLTIISTLFLCSYVAAMPAGKRKGGPDPESEPDPQYPELYLPGQAPWDVDPGTSGHTYIPESSGAGPSQPKRIRLDGNGASGSQHPQPPVNPYSSSSGNHFRSEGPPSPHRSSESHPADHIQGIPHEFSPLQDPDSLSHNPYFPHDSHFHDIFVPTHSGPDPFHSGLNHALDSAPQSLLPVANHGRGYPAAPELFHPRPQVHPLIRHPLLLQDQVQEQHNSNDNGPGDRSNRGNSRAPGRAPGGPRGAGGPLGTGSSRAGGGSYRYNCNVPGCSYGTDYRTTFMRHTNSIKHGGQKIFKCTQPNCNKGFTRVDHRDNHAKRKHDQP